jgi:hypothetical protein
MSQDTSTFLLGGSAAPALSFPTVGTAHTLTIIEPPQLKERTNFQTGEIERWNDGNPKMQLVVTGKVDESERDGEDDTLERRLYIKGQMQKAVGSAVREAGAKDLLVGGVLWVKYTGDGKAERGKNPPKQYEAKYKAPEAGTASFLGTDTPKAGGGKAPDNDPPFLHGFRPGRDEVVV